MPDYSRVKQLLQQRLDELTQRASAIESELATPGDTDWDDNAIESEDDEVQASLADLTEKDISAIKLALSRIDAGTYGVCTGCGGKISEARLEALPHTTLCIKCAAPASA